MHLERNPKGSTKYQQRRDQDGMEFRIVVVGGVAPVATVRSCGRPDRRSPFCVAQYIGTLSFGVQHLSNGSATFQHSNTSPSFAHQSRFNRTRSRIPLPKRSIFAVLSKTKKVGPRQRGKFLSDTSLKPPPPKNARLDR